VQGLRTVEEVVFAVETDHVVAVQRVPFERRITGGGEVIPLSGLVGPPRDGLVFDRDARVPFEVQDQSIAHQRGVRPVDSGGLPGRPRSVPSAVGAVYACVRRTVVADRRLVGWVRLRHVLIRRLGRRAIC